MPGVATPTEAFAALAAGADALKLFPAELHRARRSSRRCGRSAARPMRLFPVGGITPEAMAAYVAAGADGFGLGSALYKPGMTAAEVAAHRRRLRGRLGEAGDGLARARLYFGCWRPCSPGPG